MSQFEMPKARPTVLGLSRKMQGGIKKFSAGPQPVVVLKATTEDSFKIDFSAVTKAEDEFQLARVLKSETIDARNRLETDICTWIGDAKTVVFRKLWGPRWALPYAQIGFRNGSLEIPAEQDRKLEILRSIGSWFVKNPAKEVTANDLVLTSAQAVALEKALEGAVNTVENCKTDVDTKDGLRAAADERLKARIRMVADELAFVLDDLDPRWISYGLDKPGETERPGLVTGVAVAQPSPGHVRLTWEPSERAVRYQVRAQVVGKETAFSTVAEVYEEQADLTDFAPGNQVRLEVVAVNIAGESTPGEPVSVTLPLAAAA